MQSFAIRLTILAAITLCASAGSAAEKQTSAAPPAELRGLPKPAQPVPNAKDSSALSEADQEYLARDFAFISSPEIEAYVGSIADKLLQTREPALPRPRIIIYSVDGFNAMADSHGAILLSTETLRLLESEDELAALLGHELSHVVLKHPTKKRFITAFPLEVEMIGLLAATGDQTKAEYESKGTQSKQTSFAKDSLKTSQNVSLFWSDLLAPNWNKGQEREADRLGLEMMYAAGYDPDAFATLLQKLHSAQLKRSERMDQLRRDLIQRAQAQKNLEVPMNDSALAAVAVLVNQTKNSLSEKVINAAFDDIAKMSKDYDSPEQRQTLIDEYAQKLVKADAPLRPRSPLFAQALRKGAGGALLSLDAAALRAMSAVERGDLAAARESLSPFIAGSKDPASVKSAKKKGKGTKEGKGAPDSAGASKSYATLPSPHLNAAIGKVLLASQNPELAEPYAEAWVQYAFAPARAFIWRASHQADKQDLKGAIAVLEAGKKRLVTGSPFLPQLVTYAKQVEDMPQAEAYVGQCKVEDQKRRSAFSKVASLLNKPSGLHAKCLLQLGYVPKDLSPSALTLLPFKKTAADAQGATAAGTPQGATAAK